VPPGDSETMAGVVGELLQDPGRRTAMGAMARRRIEVEFSLERMVAGYEAALRQVAGEP